MSGNIPDPVEAVAAISAVPAILKLVTEMTGLRLSLVAEVTESRWLCCAVNDQLSFGLQVRGELDIHSTLCKEVRLGQRTIAISHASVDPVYKDHHTPKLYNIESYISVPIFMRTGEYFGNLCALDSQPREITQKTRTMFELFAEMIGQQLARETEHAVTQRALLDERETSALREQFIAVLGHDLRTPLAAISTGVEILGDRHVKDAPTVAILERVKRSTTNMTALVSDVMDFARGRLGGGITLEPAEVDLDAVIRNVADEAHAATSHDVRVTGSIGNVTCDRMRIAQAVMNLVSNAHQHGDRKTPIQISLARGVDAVTIAVANRGQMIDPDRLTTIFEPYQRSGKGLGLGLYIISEIARAHGGRVDATSTAEHTTFQLTLPV